MEKFYEKIKKENKQNRIWIVVWFIAVCSVVLEMHSSKNKEILIYVTLLSIASYEYFTKYFFLFKEGKYQVERFKILIFLNPLHYSNLTEIFRQHSFSLRDYMKLLVKKFLPVQIVTVIVAVLYDSVYFFCYGDKVVTIYSVIKILAVMVIPFIIALIFYKVKCYELTKDVSGTNKFFLNLGDKIIQVFKFLLSVIFYVKFVFVGYALVASRILAKPNIDCPWRISVVYTEQFLIALIILATILVFLVVSRYRTTTFRVFIGLLTLVLCGVIVVFLFKKNIVIDNQNIKVTMNFKTVEYDYDDIESYKCFEDVDKEADYTTYVYMLYMKNGRTIKVDFDSAMTDDNIEEDGQMTEKSNDEKVRKAFVKVLKEKKIIQKD